MDYGKLNSATQWEQYLLSEVYDSFGFGSEAWSINIQDTYKDNSPADVSEPKWKNSIL